MYAKIVKKKIYSTDVLTAETSKTMENAYRDVNIAFANEMAVIAEKLGVDIFEIQKLINSRSERHMHLPGAGVGGHCLSSRKQYSTRSATLAVVAAAALEAILFGIQRGLVADRADGQTAAERPGAGVRRVRGPGSVLAGHAATRAGGRH